jgi:hypothetical protein
MPGETDWDTASAFLKTLLPKFWIPDTREFISVSFPLPDNWSYDSSGSIDFFVQDGIVTSIVGLTEYSIADFLSKYGQPSEIWVVYHEDDMLAPHYRFVIALGYMEKGFLVIYGQDVTHDDRRHICPYRRFEPEELTDGHGIIHTIDHPTFPVSFWNPSDIKTFEQILSDHYPSLAEFEIFKPLEEITDLTINEFVHIYSDPETRTCVQIVK